MRRTFALGAGVAAVLLLAAAAFAQEKKMEAPKPPPETQKLAFFVGDWTSEGEMKPGPWGAGGKLHGTSHCGWMYNGFFMMCHEDGSSDVMGKVAGLGVMGYDPAAKVYTWNGFNSMGENERAAGTYDGKTWTFLNESVMDGKTVKGRYSVTETSPTTYDFKLDTSLDGQTWSAMMEGKVTKVASKKMEKKS